MSENIKDLNQQQLEALVTELGQPKYRASQVYDWLHTHNVATYDEMTNVPKALREQLVERYPLSPPIIKESLTSADGSVKYLIEFPDGTVAETVAIVNSGSNAGSAGGAVDSGRTGSAWGAGDTGRAGSTGDAGGNRVEESADGRITVCVSSQAGCAMECAFCATGKQGFTRDLDTDEIVAQVVRANKDLGERISNVVVMGQGEPFLNYDNVLAALRRINQDKGLNIGARHITLSTSGIVEGIYDFAEEPEQFRLAVSLHSADQGTRNEIMPRLSGQPLHSLKKALSYYCDTKGRRITLEYMLLDGINDSDEQLEKLIEFCKDLNVHVNLLEFNPIRGSKLKAAPRARIKEWIDALQSKGITASLRHSKGRDVAGACGQLANSAKG